MNRNLIVAAILGLLAAPAFAGEIGGPVSAEALHFRAEIGVEPGHVVCGWIDESKGTGEGYDVAVLDLDGDGKPDERQAFPLEKSLSPGRERRATKISVEHEGATWVLDLYSLGYRRPPVNEGVADIHLRWSVTAGERYNWFINGRTKLYTSAEMAREAAPIRLGPPFRFAIATRIRGREALVCAGLKDAQGSTLRLSRQAGTIVPPVIRLRKDGEEKHSEPGTYG